MNGKLTVCVGRVCKAKTGIMKQYNGLLRVVGEYKGGFVCRNESSDLVMTKKFGKRVPRVFRPDDLMVAK